MASRPGKPAFVPRIPYAAPRWPKGDALLFAAAGFAAASAAPLTVALLQAQDRHFFRHLDPEQVLFPALASGLLLAWKALNARGLLAAVSWALIGGPVAGAFAGTLTALSIIALGKQQVMLADSALLGIPFGALFGVVLAWLAGAGARIKNQRAHDAFDRVLVAIGIWLIAIYGAILAGLDGQALEAVARIGLMLGAAALAAGVLRRRLRIAWLTRVRAGSEIGWSLRDWNVVAGVDRLVPLFGANPLSCDAVLVHVADTPGQPYRGARGEVAVALAPGARVQELAF
jgi:hypothetical protein